MGNPSFPGETTSGGKNWIGHLVSSNPALLSYNFAQRFSYIDPHLGSQSSLAEQVALFGSASSEIPWVDTSSLFAIWLAIEDVGNHWWAEDFYEQSLTLLHHYFSQVQTLYASGARNFVFLSVPPLSKTPAMGWSDEASRQAEAIAIPEFNDLLYTAFDHFRTNNPGVNAWFVDTVGVFNEALDNPGAFGVTDPLCFEDGRNEEGQSCLWWNDYHPGIDIHSLVADAVASSVGI